MTRLRRLQSRVGRLHAGLLRLSRGRIRRSLLLAGGQPVLVLSTIGRRSGKVRTTTVAYVRHGEGYAVGALNLGSDWQPSWCLNLRAYPHAWVELEGERHEMRTREAQGQEAERLWERFYDQLSLIRNTRRVARRQVPMIVLERLAAAESLREEVAGQGQRPDRSLLACARLARLPASGNPERAWRPSIDGLPFGPRVSYGPFDVQPNAHELRASRA
jgi:deazaflavin-dependent oxidoreductase (nitroreductase family)